jgi:transaldolase / glucose-6-phosphate isomerase
MNSIQKLTSLGQSIWYDNIQRRLLDNGELADMISRGDIRGVTSNPSIFHNAISKTYDYDSALMPMAWSGWNAETIFWQLAIEDIRRACDLFRPLYEQTKGGDGYVSLEVHPALAHNTDATLAQAKYLWERVACPNLMIKIPATKEGLPAIRAAIAAGINVNVTLIFSIERYCEVMEAYLTGLEEGKSAGADLNSIASVASFFISRMDTKVDALLPDDSPLRGKAAIANAKLAYAAFCETFTGPRWDKFAKAGARLQRPLWASTSTKNPAYADTIYVDNLIGPDSVNTVPPQTLDAFRNHGHAAVTITNGLDDARRAFAELELHGISIDRVTQELETEGVKAFADAFSAMLKTIDERRTTAVSALGPLAGSVARRVSHLEADAVPARLWSGDPSLWTSDPQGQDEIRKRLGWLKLPETSRKKVKEINTFANEIYRVGISKFLLLGMGGSSLAPEVLSLVFPSPFPPLPMRDGKGARSFAILDSTDPAQVAQAAKDFPPSESLYIVSSKSGGTAEVNAMLDYFWHLSGNDGSRFVAITDPGTSLDALANARGFRKTFRADPTVGGRFSVLADFGLLPAALMGFDIEKILASAAAMMHECGAEISAARNPGLVLGAVMGEAALAGRDKLTLFADPQVAAFGSWLEQLIAESSGKQGKGVVVVDGEPVTGPESYGTDRLFVYLKVTGDHEQAVNLLRQSGHPVAEFLVTDTYSLISEFYRWEIATAVACHILGVNAFDQPDVQDNKTRTKDRIIAYNQYGKLDEPQPFWTGDMVRAFTNQNPAGIDLASIVAEYLALAKSGSYVAINAYLPRNAVTLAALTELRLKVRARTGCATTVGFGPRFLHSTGQLHKGGPESGLFLQITADAASDFEIPTEGLTFGVLERAQALGDYEALAVRGRKILRVHLSSPDAVQMLVDAVK